MQDKNATPDKLLIPLVVIISISCLLFYSPETETEKSTEAVAYKFDIYDLSFMQPLKPDNAYGVPSVK